MIEMIFSYLNEDEIAAILVPFMDNNSKLILEDFLGRWEKPTKDRIDSKQQLEGVLNGLLEVPEFTSKLATKIALKRQFRLDELNREYELTTF